MLDLKKPILDLDDQPIAGPTMADVCVGALLSSVEEDRNLPGEEKMKRFLLAQRIHRDETVSLISEEISKVKMLVARGYTPIVVGRVWAELDPACVN